MAFKVIETLYKGILFRSRLEARWAVFFDHLGITWHYEPEGFNFNGVKYLVDFWLPDFKYGIFVEVKPFTFLPAEASKGELLVLNLGHTLLKAIDWPKNKPYEFIYYEVCGGVGNTDFYFEHIGLNYSKEFYHAAVNAALSERFNNG